MSDEEIYCDECSQESSYTTTVTSCPVIMDWIDDHKAITKNICINCCREIFEDGDCEGECCEDFIDEWREDKFNELFEKTNFEKVEDLLFMNKFKSLAIGYYEKDLNNITPKIKARRKDFVLPEIYYPGDEFFLIKYKGKIVSYEKDLLNKAESFLEKAHELNLGYNWEYKTNGKLLLLEGEYIWCVIPPLKGKESITNEEINFNDRYQKGLEFFNIRIVNKLNWSLIDDKQFEDLCCDLLESLDNFENVKKMGGGAGELKRDITTTEKIITHFGPEYRKWLVQCKHYNKRKVNPDDLDGLFEAIPAHDSDGVLVMTSNELTPGAKRVLEKFDKNEKTPFKAKWIERNYLEKLLEENQKIFKRYFS